MMLGSQVRGFTLKIEAVGSSRMKNMKLLPPSYGRRFHLEDESSKFF
jgi:hypothetical protein